MDNYFARLNQINVSEHLEKKGELQLPLLALTPWPSCAWPTPTATWEVRRFDGLPYLKTETGYFVEVAVTVQGVTLAQIHPVLDGKNRPIPEPTAFDINTSSSAAWSRRSRCTGSVSTSTPARTCPKARAARSPRSRRSSASARSPSASSASSSGSWSRRAGPRRGCSTTSASQSTAELPMAEFDRAMKALQQAKRRAA